MMWLDVIFQFDIVRCASESAERAVESLHVVDFGLGSDPVPVCPTSVLLKLLEYLLKNYFC
jgi:hypothetical protein